MDKYVGSYFLNAFALAAVLTIRSSSVQPRQKKISDVPIRFSFSLTSEDATFGTNKTFGNLGDVSLARLTPSGDLDVDELVVLWITRFCALGSMPPAGSPENITIMFLTPSSIRVSWTTSIDHVDKYDVTYKPTDARSVPTTHRASPVRGDLFRCVVVLVLTYVVGRPCCPRLYC